MSKKYNIAVVGATGAVGQMMIKILIERKFPIDNLYLLASKKSKGKIITIEGNKYQIDSLEEFNFKEQISPFFLQGEKYLKNMHLLQQKIML
jgi:aspartate-semialdehyde dehydrogenase